MPAKVPVYLEIGSKRTFACAVDWQGWCRHGRDAEEALAALYDYAPRYARVLAGTGLGFEPPADPAALEVVERLDGNVTTDFGAPAIPPTVDRSRSCPPDQLARYETILRAGWRAFDAAVEAARGKELAKGPRGGGRSLDAIVKHVAEAEAGYIRAAGGKAPKADDPAELLRATRDAVLDTLTASATGGIPERGPRGGERWTARFFARRASWHVISHAWEIERRVVRPG